VAFDIARDATRSTRRDASGGGRCEARAPPRRRDLAGREKSLASRKKSLHPVLVLLQFLAEQKKPGEAMAVTSPVNGKTETLASSD
jgi:hypothetical protein